MKKVLFVLLLFTGLAVGETSGLLFHSFFPTAYPDPAVPGSDVRLEVTIENWGKETYYNISTEVIPSYPFSGVEVKGFIPRLDPGQKSTVVYILHVDKNADPGQYTLNHKLTYYYAEWSESEEKTRYWKIESMKTIGINVENKEKIEVSGVDVSGIGPGEEGNVTVHLLNDGNVDISNIKVSLSVPSPLFVKPPSEKEIDMKTGEETVLDFQIYASKLASSGSYTGTITVEYNGNSYSENFIIDVSGYPPLAIESIRFDKPPEPGKECKMVIDLVNHGSSALRGFYVSLAPIYISETGGLTSGATTKQIFSVIGSSARYVDRIGPGEKKSVEFEIAFSKDAEERPYSIDLTISGGDFETITQKIGINLKGIPHLVISDLDEDVDVIYAGEPFKLSVQLENEGSGDARNVVAKIDDQTVFLGTIKSEDTSTASFRLIEGSGTKEITITAEYADNQGNRYAQNFTVKIRVYPKPIPWGYIIGLIVLIAVGYIAYKKFIR